MIRRWICWWFGHEATWTPCYGTGRPHSHRRCPRCGLLETREDAP